MAKILIVEDAQDVKEILDIFLSKKGFQILKANNGKEGIELTRQYKPDLVLLDVSLPDFNGIEVLKEIREFDKSAKVVMLSGLVTEELEEQARQAGATRFLAKSSGIEEIVKEITDMFC